MPSWVVKTLLYEAAGLILVVTGCFVAGMVSEAVCIARAEDARKRHADTERYARMFTDMRRSVERSNRMLSAERELSRHRSVPAREPTTFYADNVAYTQIQIPDTECRVVTFWDGTQMVDYPLYGTVERR